MSNAPEERIEEDEDTAEAPLTMAASMILGSLPKDASKALESAGTGGPEKVKIRLQPISGAPALKQKVFLLTSSQRFEVIITHLRKKLKVQPHESVHCYVGNVFSPSLDEVVLNLWNCFKSNEELVIGYAMTPAFG